MTAGFTADMVGKIVFVAGKIKKCFHGSLLCRRDGERGALKQMERRKE